MRIENAITIKIRSEPATPPAGKVVIYVDSADNKVKYKNSSGTVKALE
jgi:hypothetical protein